MKHHILYESAMKMKGKQKNPNLSKIWLLVPKNFLQQFDTATKNTHTSRNEAIRYAMQLTYREAKQQKTHPQNQITQTHQTTKQPQQKTPEKTTT